MMLDKKEIAFWGGGALCRAWLDGGFDEHVKLIIDNWPENAKKIIKDKKVVAPSEIDDFNSYFIIITSNYYEEIRKQLESYGLVYERDFISYRDYPTMPINVLDVTNTIREIVFEGQKYNEEILNRVRSKKEYDTLHNSICVSLLYEKALNKLYQKKIGKRIVYPGYCSICNKNEEFSVDYTWSDGTMPAWRETVFCTDCNMNSRMRFLVEYILSSVDKNANVYICEQVTPTYKALKSKLNNLIGSEYLGSEHLSGDKEGEIMHQDVLNLSFDDEAFDCIVSADVYEHVADFKTAFKEAYRCLKKGGKLIFSIPIFKDQEKSVTRTVIEDGQIKNILPPVYHGNPLSLDGSLVFTDFGWDVLEVLKENGFKDSFAVVYFSTSKGYFGDLPLIFEAIK